MEVIYYLLFLFHANYIINLNAILPMQIKINGMELLMFFIYRYIEFLCSDWIDST